MKKALQDLVHAHEVGMGASAIKLRVELGRDALHNSGVATKDRGAI